MINEHGRVPSTELNSSHRSRPGGEIGSAAAHHFVRDRRDRSRRGHFESNACTGAAPVAVPNQGELRTPFGCPPATLALDDVVNVQSGTRPPGGTAEAASCGPTRFNVSRNCAEDMTIGVGDGDFSPTHA
jgi:hypothetical protein